jgi:hypothetical protein
LRGEGLLRGGRVGIARFRIHLAAVNVHGHILNGDGAIGRPEPRWKNERMLTLERRGVAFDPDTRINDT